jgi:uncharacterized integral membrane protein (TIGR00698 family)
MALEPSGPTYIDRPADQSASNSNQNQQMVVDASPVWHPQQEPESAGLVDLLPGIIMILLVGAAAYYISSFSNSLDALAVAILLGLATRVILGRAKWLEPGARVGVKIFIPIGIMLYGVNLDFSRVASLPIGTITLTILCMLVFYILIFWLNALWQLPSDTSELIASGSAVCGASAIAVLSPAVDAEPEDTSISLLVVTAIGLLGVMFYPIIKDILGLSDTAYAVFSGATLHQTGLVRVALSSVDQATADYGMAVKTIRIVMLAGVSVVTGLLHSNVNMENADSENLSRDLPLLYSLRRVWFLLPFILLGILVSFVPNASSILSPIKPWATLSFSIGLGSIGLMVDIESVLNAGSRPLLVGFIGWIGVVIFFLFASTILL